jgi:hypothetical protein
MLHKEELINISRSPSIARVVKSRRIQWAVMLLDEGHKECIQNFGEETCRETSTWTIEEEVGGQH